MMKKKELYIVIGIAVIALIAIFFLKHPVSNDHQPVVAIKHKDQIVQTFNPNENAIYHIKGSYGTLDVEVQDGSWRVINEECPNHICHKMGWKTVEDIDLIICLPNEIVIEVIEQ